MKKIEPKVYLTINRKQYKAINPDEALEVSKELVAGSGSYKVHVIYGEEKVSKRKRITVENEGKYESAKETKQAIKAFLDKSLWMSSYA